MADGGPQLPAPLSVSMPATYSGYVYVRSEGKQRAPGLSQVRLASELLQKPKKAQNIHPLFARGFDTTLNLSVRKGLLPLRGLCV